MRKRKLKRTLRRRTTSDTSNPAPHHALPYLVLHCCTMVHRLCTNSKLKLLCRIDVIVQYL